MEESILKSKLIPNGSIFIEGTLEITLSDGKTVVTKRNPSLCRCGHSKNKPFCDGSHAKRGWKE